MAYNETVNVNINANTSDLDGLEKSLESSEIKIKTLGGAINVLGGSVEILAGGLALTGAVTEEQAEKFQSAAVGAIAFADGTKRVFEGYKELKEATKLATQAQVANNLAVLSNPYVAAAAAVTAFAVALTGALVYFSRTEQQLEKINENLAENVKLTDSQRSSIASQTAELKKLETIVKDETIAEETRQKALNKLAEILPELEGLDIDRADAIGQVTVAIGREIEAIQKRAQAVGLEERLIELYKEQARVQEELMAASMGNISSQEDLRLFLLQAGDGADLLNTKFGSLGRELIGINSDINETATSIANMSDYVVDLGDNIENTSNTSRDKVIEVNIKPKIIVPGGEASPSTLAEWFESQIDPGEAQLQPVIKPEYDGSEVDLGVTTLSERLIVAQGKINDFLESQTAEAIQGTLGTASNLLGVIQENIDESNEEGFNKAKGYKIAETRVTSIQAAFEAYKGVVGVPIVGPVLAPIAAAAALAAGQKAINDIKASTFGDTSAPDFSAPGGTPSAPGGGSGTGGGIPAIPGFGTSGVTSLNAVVLSGDVTSAQAQDAAIRSRRRFGRGG